MSFIIAVHVNEGIVVASDRRTTYSNTIEMKNKTINRIGVHTTDSTDKTFICPNGASISTCGESSIKGIPITGFIEDMIRKKINKDCLVDDMPNILINYFNEIGENTNTNFLIVGYQKENENDVQKIYKVVLQGGMVEQIDTNSQGAIWDGEILTLTRILQNTYIKQSDGTFKELPHEEILWNFFTLQDAIDFARYAVETTINTMRFKNVVETVGGKVDILIVKPEKTEWLQKDELR